MNAVAMIELFTKLVLDKEVDLQHFAFGRACVFRE